MRGVPRAACSVPKAFIDIAVRSTYEKEKTMTKLVLTGLLMGAGVFAENSIPAGAKEVEPYVYSATDAQGAQWMYRQTPFGLTKWRPSDVPPPAVKEQPNPVTAADLGDRIRFERNTPFGQYVWTTKKSELTGDEKLLLNIAAEKK